MRNRLRAKAGRRELRTPGASRRAQEKGVPGRRGRDPLCPGSPGASRFFSPAASAPPPSRWTSIGVITDRPVGRCPHRGGWVLFSLSARKRVEIEENREDCDAGRRRSAAVQQLRRTGAKAPGAHEARTSDPGAIGRGAASRRRASEASEPHSPTRRRG